MVKKRIGKNMIMITVHLTEQQIKGLDRLVKAKLFPNRSEAIRVAVRELIDKYSMGQRNRIDELFMSFV